MPFRSLDPRFPSLTFHFLVFYWVICLVTLGLTIGSVVMQVGVYRANCTVSESSIYQAYSTTDQCIPGDIVVFALGLGVATTAMVQSSVQVVQFYRHRLSPRLLSILSAIVMVMWIIVIAIGWNPTSYTTDPDTGLSTPDFSGWLYIYSGYWTDESYDSGVSTTLALDMGFIVMSIVSFGMVTLWALYAFVVHHRNSRRQMLADNEASVAAPNLNEKSSGEPKQITIASEATHSSIRGFEQHGNDNVVIESAQSRLSRSRSV